MKTDLYKILSLNTNYYSNKPHLTTSYNSYSGEIHYDHVKSYEILYEKFINNKLKPNTSVYITPLSQYPSYKLKNFSEENKLNITTTRKFNNLNAIIINDNFIRDNYFSSNDELNKEYYIIPYQYVIDNFKKYIDKSNEWRDISCNQTQYFLIKKEELNTFTNVDNIFSIITEFPIIKGYLISNSHGNKKVCENIEFFKNLTSLVEKYNLEIIFDNSINQEINQDLSVDLDVFKTLFSMLSSDDESNYSLAKELIANCEFESSKPYILFLSVLFSTLRIKSSNNRNWVVAFNQISQYKKYLGQYFSSRNNLEISDVDFFIKNFIPDYPQYKQTICDCLLVYFNHNFKIDLIKEIKST